MAVKKEVETQSAGAGFFRVDLHIHSAGASHDVRDTDLSPKNIIAAAKTEGISVVAITDHNEISSVETGLQAAAGSDVFVVPGVELSTAQGHLLVYFRTLDSLRAFYGKLEIVDRNTAESRCQTGLLECLKMIDPQNGFAILAHVDGPGGLEERVPSMTPHKIDILTHNALLGVEMRAAESLISYGDGDPDTNRASVAKKRRTALNLGERQCLARTLFSDAHSLKALGRNASGNKRITRMKMDAPSFDGVIVALFEADSRVRLEDEIPSSVPYIKGMKIEGGFLDGEIIHFSRNLNCIIGGRGAGKSTALEAARSLSTRKGESPLVDSEAWPDELFLIWCDETGAEHVIRRGKGFDGENVENSELGPIAFEIECYGQGEMARTSTLARSDPGALLGHIDQFVELGDLREKEREIRGKLLDNQGEIQNAEANIAKIPIFERALQGARQQLKALEEAKGKEIIQLERKLAEEQTVRKRIRENLEKLKETISDAFPLDVLDEIMTLSNADHLTVGSLEYRTIVANAKAFKAKAITVKSELEKQLAGFRQSTETALDQWGGREKAMAVTLTEKKRELENKGIKLDIGFIKKLAESEAQHGQTVGNLKTWIPYLKNLKTERMALLTKKDTIRGQIAARRTAYAKSATKALEGTLGDLQISVKYKEHALSPEGKTIIQDAMSWRTTQVPRADALIYQLTVPGLLVAIQKNNPAPIVACVSGEGEMLFSKQDAFEIIKRLGEPQRLFSLQQCEVEDAPRITVTKKIRDSSGKEDIISREFSKLSLGQQQSVLLALMLTSKSTAPLVIDQPEDHLDGEFIYSSLVPVLRQAKERRQVIVVTHNANLAILTDAEQILALKSLSNRGRIVARGSIDSAPLRSVAGKILEGSAEAFMRRGQLYGLHIERCAHF